MERAARDAIMPVFAAQQSPRHHAPAPLFTITVRCRDGERVAFSTTEAVHGLTVSPTKCGAKIAAIIANYRPLPGPKAFL